MSGQFVFVKTVFMFPQGGFYVALTIRSQVILDFFDADCFHSRHSAGWSSKSQIQSFANPVLLGVHTFITLQSVCVSMAPIEKQFLHCDINSAMIFEVLLM